MVAVISKVFGLQHIALAEDIVSDADVSGGGGRNGIKSSGLLMVDRILWMFVRNYKVDGDYRNARLAWSNWGRVWPVVT